MKGLYLKTKAINSKSNDSPSISKDIYDELLDERMDEIPEMSREIDFNNLIYNFKGWSPSISFTEFGGSTYTYNQLKNGDEALRQVEDQKNVDWN